MCAEPGKDASKLIRIALANAFRIGCARKFSRAFPGMLCAWAIAVVVAAFGLPTSDAAAEIHMPPIDPHLPITIEARQGHRWQQGAYEVWTLSGGCSITQGTLQTRADEGVVWIDRADPTTGMTKLIIYLEDGDAVIVDYRLPGPSTPAAANNRLVRVADATWMGRYYTRGALRMEVSARHGEPHVKPAVYRRGVSARNAELSAVRPAQFVPSAPPQTVTPQVGSLPPGTRRVRVYPRSSTGIQAQTFPSPHRDEFVAVITTGVNMIIDGLDQVGTVDISTDRMIIWSAGAEQLNLSGENVQQRDIPLEIYMEGNIVFRQGDRLITANAMYYDVARESGVVLGAELLTPVPDYQGLLRLKADVLQQLNRSQFVATNAAMTSSRLGVPEYWIQSGNISVQDVQIPLTNPFTGQPEIDPVSGDPLIDHQLQATSRNNFLYYNEFPVLYWPVLATDLTKPNFYVDDVRLRSDSTFGFQVLTDWDLYQLLGVRSPLVGTAWTASVDYLSERGFAAGTNFQYDRLDFLGVSGPVRGEIDAWGIHDSGLDNLGADRRDLVPEDNFRGRVRANHRQMFGNGWQFSAEVGFISDRNFLEEYYENEWDTFKDQDTRLQLKQYIGNSSWSIIGEYGLNGFVTHTNRLPRGDHFLIGQSIFGDLFTWHAHTFGEYAQLEVTDRLAPAFPDMGDPLDWEQPTALTGSYGRREGVRAGTRQEIDLPLQIGPVKFVPYLLGEIAYWQEDRDGLEATRAYGQAGIRASLPIWSVNPAVQRPLLNVNGLAHKAVFDAEFFYADANEDLNRFPLYDPLDDDSQEFFRRRFYIPTGTLVGVPAAIRDRYEERFFALRSGMQSNVTGPTEIADDLTMFRFGIHQRWQTKRGLPGRQRIIDWITFDTDFTLFPEADRDNFGQLAGPISYQFKWLLGDRVTVLSDGFFELFGQGLRTVNAGFLISRPGRGSLYGGIRSIEGPVSSNALLTTANYRMSEKWIVSLTTSLDLSSTGNVAQSVRFVRIGESVLVSFGVYADDARDDIGVLFSIEPRFLPNQRLGRIAGVSIPPAGAYGLE